MTNHGRLRMQKKLIKATDKMFQTIDLTVHIGLIKRC